MDIEQLKKWCKEQAEYYAGEMNTAIANDELEYYDYCNGMQYAYWSVYYKIVTERK